MSEPSLREVLQRYRAGDAEAVHDLRTTARRLRIAHPELTEELRWLGRELSAARDAEVLRDRLDELLADEPDSLAAERLIHRRLRADLRSGRQRADRALRSRRTGRLLRRLDRPADPDDAVPSASRKVSRRVRDADPEHPETLHKLRKAAKGLRYAANAAGDDALAKRAKKVQRRLGDYQDAVVSRRLLADLVRAHPRSGRAAFVLGRLDAREQWHAGRSLRRGRKAWRKLARELD